MCPNPKCYCYARNKSKPPVWRIRQASYIGNRTVAIRLMRGGQIKLRLSKSAWNKLLLQVLSNAE